MLFCIPLTCCGVAAQKAIPAQAAHVQSFPDYPGVLRAGVGRNGSVQQSIAVLP
jgi:hypothetical protein